MTVVPFDARRRKRRPKMPCSTTANRPGHVQEILHSLDVFRKVTGIPLEDICNLMLAKGWTLGSALGLRFMQMVIRMNYGPMFRLLSQHWKDTQPDLLVSLVPNFNRVLF